MFEEGDDGGCYAVAYFEGGAGDGGGVGEGEVEGGVGDGFGEVVEVEAGDGDYAFRGRWVVSLG